jgi:hypothetical protein
VATANGGFWPEVRVLTNRRNAANYNSNIVTAAPSSNWCYRPEAVGAQLETMSGFRLIADAQV